MENETVINLDVISLDIRGQICPACLLISLKEINKHKGLLRNGEANLIVRTDHRDATRTIPDAAVAMGYAVSVEKKKGYYEITVGRKDEDQKA
ncbi:MAG: sulfurtransferase TusA family protein [Nitrospirae bacterium]|nr:sulfurtransferase TusA family protein [Nitrospirota bacterium]MDA8338483.1 sulfurtransferase TusA family protein [Nitrospiraceae bacterium]